MIKRISNLIFASTLIFSLNAKNTEEIILKEFGDKNFKIKIEYKPEAVKNVSKNNKEQLILETITTLTKEIDPAEAAKGYIEYMKEIFNKFKSGSLFADLTECKSTEESSKALGLIMQNLMNDMSKKENILKQAVYFSSFSGEVIKGINSSLSTEIQKFIGNTNMFVLEKTKEIKEKNKKEITAINLDVQNAINIKSNQFFDDLIESINKVFKKHYKI